MSSGFCGYDFNGRNSIKPFGGLQLGIFALWQRWMLGSSLWVRDSRPRGGSFDRGWQRDQRSGGRVRLGAGRGAVATGGASVVVGGGEGTCSSSGYLSLGSTNSGASGSGGRLAFSSGSSKDGNSGAVALGSGPSVGGRAG